MKMDSVMGDGSKLMPEEQVRAKALVTGYKDFADKYPSDSLSPKFLFEAARLQMIIPDYPAALELLNTITDKYPENALAPVSLTTSAAICENVLKNCDKAAEYLRTLKEKYPNHPTAVNIDLQIQYVCDPEGYLNAVIQKSNHGQRDTVDVNGL